MISVCGLGLGLAAVFCDLITDMHLINRWKMGLCQVKFIYIALYRKPYCNVCNALILHSEQFNQEAAGTSLHNALIPHQQTEATVARSPLAKQLKQCQQKHEQTSVLEARL